MDQRALRRLLTACERAKRTLSSSTQADIEIDALSTGMDFNFSITRARFEKMNRDIFDQCLRLVEAGLRDAGRYRAEDGTILFDTKPRIDTVLLVGGSTRIPKVHQMLKEFFGKEPCTPSNRHEAATYGASMQARILSGVQTEILNHFMFLDATSLDLGYQIGDGEVTSSSVETVILNNYTMPFKTSITIGGSDVTSDGVDVSAKKIKGFFGKKMPGIFGKNNSKKPETGLLVRVFERRGKGFGSVDGSPWHLLGKVILHGFPSMPVPEKIEVTFDAEMNGCLIVTVMETSTGKKASLEVGKSNMSVEDIERMADRVSHRLTHRAPFA